MSNEAAGGFREPLQERSRQTVRQLLAAAEQSFAQDGYDRSSVRLIARRAGVPVGSLYQFFDGKQAVLDVLVADYLRAVDDLFDELATAGAVPGESIELDDAVRLVVGRLLAVAAERPAFRALVAEHASSGPSATAGRALNDRLTARIHETVSGEPLTPGGVPGMAAVVCTEIVRGLLPRVVAVDGAVDGDLAHELVTVLVAYLAVVKSRPR